MKKRTAIKTDLFADEHHRKKIDTLGDPLAEIESYIDFGALAEEVDRVAPRPVSPQGGRPPYPTRQYGKRVLEVNQLFQAGSKKVVSHGLLAGRFLSGFGLYYYLNFWEIPVLPFRWNCSFCAGLGRFAGPTT